MKNANAMGTDRIPIPRCLEYWKKWIVKHLNKILEVRKMPGNCRSRLVVPICKIKVDYIKHQCIK